MFGNGTDLIASGIEKERAFVSWRLTSWRSLDPGGFSGSQLGTGRPIRDWDSLVVDGWLVEGGGCTWRRKERTNEGRVGGEVSEPLYLQWQTYLDLGGELPAPPFLAENVHLGALAGCTQSTKLVVVDPTVSRHRGPPNVYLQPRKYPLALVSSC